MPLNSSYDTAQALLSTAGALALTVVAVTVVAVVDGASLVAVVVLGAVVESVSDSLAAGLAFQISADDPTVRFLLPPLVVVLDGGPRLSTRFFSEELLVLLVGTVDALLCCCVVLLIFGVPLLITPEAP